MDIMELKMDELRAELKRRGLTPAGRKKIDLQKQLQSDIERTRNTSCPSRIVLVIDAPLLSIPWESLGFFEGAECVTRVFSLAHLTSLCARFVVGDCASFPVQTMSSLLDPEDNLSSTKERISAFLPTIPLEMQTQVVGRSPTSDEMR